LQLGRERPVGTDELGPEGLPVERSLELAGRLGQLVPSRGLLNGLQEPARVHDQLVVVRFGLGLGRPPRGGLADVLRVRRVVVLRGDTEQRLERVPPEVS
jgi:hypothetical protein